MGLDRRPSRGARVLFVADTCYGGGMAREVDPRAETMSFRQVPSYRLSVDLLNPIATTSDEMLSARDRRRWKIEQHTEERERDADEP